VARVEEGSGETKAAADRGATRGLVQSSAGAVGALHMADRSGAARRAEEQRREREDRRRRTGL
jgi:hypothetical protein